MKLRRGLLLTVGLSAGPVACAFGLDGYTGGGGAPSEAGADAIALVDTGGSDATTDGPFASCPSGRGPQMVLIDDGKGTRFCIDSTEVTNAQYAAFLSTSPKTSEQPAVCGGNASYDPSNRQSFDSIAMTDYPVTFVDWCDARAFCDWAGKRLCGRIGGGSLATDDDRADPQVSQFMYACTKGAPGPYPYGATYTPAICNAGGGGASWPFPVTPGGACEGGFPGITYLVGNVGEWTDDCSGDGGASDSCPLNSSSFAFVFGDPQTVSRCDHFDPQSRGDTYLDLGFRCCFD